MMYHWICEESTQTTASPEAIWRLWSNLDTWAQWDAGVEWARLETTFTQGKHIIMKPLRGPEVRCLLEEVTALRSFSTRSQLPLTSIRFMHSMDAGTVMHRVEMHGLLAPLFKRLFGKNIQEGLPQVLCHLVAQAEARTAARAGE